MLKFLADENFHNHIVRGARRRLSEIDLFRVHEVGLSGADDPTVLAWAADNDRVLLTHDVHTVWAFAAARIEKQLPMPGVIFVTQPFLLAEVISDLLLMWECISPEELDGGWRYLPLR